MRTTPRALPSPLAFAACVRAGVLAWSVLASLLTAGVQWDTSQRVAYEASISGATPRGKWDAPVQAYLAPLANWDGIHFTAIAERGYAYEQLHAFFPGWPLAMRSVALTVLRPMLAAQLLSFHSALILSGVFLSFLCACLSAQLLYSFTYRLCGDRRFALFASYMFALTPAGVFMAAAYTESAFTLCSFAGMYAVVRALPPRTATPRMTDYLQYGWLAAAVLAFAASSSIRSNGLLSVGFVVYAVAHINANDALAAASAGTRIARYVLHMALLVLAAAVIAAPLVAFAYYAFYLYCEPPPEQLAAWFPPRTAGVAPFQQRPWCARPSDSKLPFFVPPIYTFVQAEYWKVGWLKYYRLANLPHFLMAAPVLSLAAAAVVAYLGSAASFARAVRESAALLLNLLPPLGSVKRLETASGVPLPAPQPVPPSPQAASAAVQTPSPQPAAAGAAAHGDTFSSPLFLPFVVHWALLSATGATMMHVHVTTRLVGACPPLYWYAAHLLLKSSSSMPSRRHAGCACLPSLRTLLIGYCAAYTLIGGALFTSFYPWC